MLWRFFGERGLVSSKTSSSWSRMPVSRRQLARRATTKSGRSARSSPRRTSSVRGALRFGSMPSETRVSPVNGLIPALEPAHAIAHVRKLAPTLPKDNLLVMNMCGRGDKDVFAVAKHLGVSL